MTNSQAPQPAPEHTPGPWVCEASYGNHGLRIDSEASGTLGHVRAFIPSGEIRHGSEVLMRWEEGFANARLIAAAPEMLAVLQAYDAWADKTPPADKELRALREQMRAAIAKATGAQA